MKKLQSLFDQSLLFRVGIFWALSLGVAILVFLLKERGGYVSPLG